MLPEQLIYQAELFDIDPQTQDNMRSFVALAGPSLIPTAAARLTHKSACMNRRARQFSALLVAGLRCCVVKSSSDVHPYTNSLEGLPRYQQSACQSIAESCNAPEPLLMVLAWQVAHMVLRE